MRFFLYLLLSVSAFSVNAQDFNNGKSLHIPPVNNPAIAPPANSPSIKAPSIFDSKKSEGIKGTEPNSNFGKPSEFANPNERIIEKLNKTENELENAIIRKNQYMGDVKTKSETVRVNYRDHEYPDGDMIMILVNDQIVKTAVYLDSSSQGFQLPLEKGFNKIDFKALNQGSSGPNTAQFEIYDDDGTLISSNKWNLATGFTATIIVVKE